MDFEEIKARHAIASDPNNKAAVFIRWTFAGSTAHKDRGELIAEVERLRKVQKISDASWRELKARVEAAEAKLKRLVEQLTEEIMDGPHIRRVIFGQDIYAILNDYRETDNG